MGTSAILTFNGPVGDYNYTCKPDGRTHTVLIELLSYYQDEIIEAKSAWWGKVEETIKLEWSEQSAVLIDYLAKGFAKYINDDYKKTHSHDRYHYWEQEEIDRLEEHEAYWDNEFVILITREEHKQVGRLLYLEVDYGEGSKNGKLILTLN
jgi:hypothetical protein